MACLGSVLYDPAVAATASTASLLAMTAFDTTNARITFTAPANGIVLVRIRAAGKGATTMPSTLLGVLDGATVKGRQVPISGRFNVTATSLMQREVAFLVTGLTPSNSYTWDAAYGVQVVVASTQFGWGGPNNTVASDAYGALSYEIWETKNLLGGVMYDPAVAVVSKTTAAASVLTAFDTTNLRLTFTAPSSGLVLVRLRGTNFGSTAQPAVHFGVLEASTVIGRTAVFQADQGNAAATEQATYQAEFVVSGVAAGSHTWDAAFATETGQGSTKMAYGGPNDASGADAYGGFAYEIWTA